MFLFVWGWDCLCKARASKQYSKDWGNLTMDSPSTGLISGSKQGCSTECMGSVAKNHQGHIRDIQEAMQCQESKAGCILQLYCLPVSHWVFKNPVLAEESMLESPK